MTYEGWHPTVFAGARLVHQIASGMEVDRVSFGRRAGENDAGAEEESAVEATNVECARLSLGEVAKGPPLSDSVIDMADDRVTPCGGCPSKPLIAGTNGSSLGVGRGDWGGPGCSMICEGAIPADWSCAIAGSSREGSASLARLYRPGSSGAEYETC